MFFRKKIFPSPPSLQHVTPLKNAFAHNDYASNFPLFDSLSLGFNFIEADIHCINDELFVSHLRPFFPNKNKTLRKLYLEPLFNYFKKNNQRIYPNSNQPLNLFIDIKTEAEKTYACLKKQLAPFEEMFCSCNDDNFQTSAIQIIISGNRPIKTIQAETNRHVFIDGRLDDIGKGFAKDLMPMISAKYSHILGWSFFSKIPSKENLLKLQHINSQIKSEDKNLRLWAIPENESIWQMLQKHGLEIISTDRISNLSSFFHNQKLIS